MMSDRKRSYVISALLALPPVVVVGAFCNRVVPEPEKVPAVVVANDPQVDLLPHREANANQPGLVRVAQRLH